MVQNIRPKFLKIPDQFPQFFDFDGSQLKLFIQYYYEWLETNQGPDYYTRNILNYNDVDFKENGYEIFDEFLKNEFMKDIPKQLLVDDRLLLKNIKDFYKAKGTEDAVSLLFRILYNEDVEFEYPGKYILRASDGRWLIEKSLDVVLLIDINDVSQYDFVVGKTSKASAKIQRIEQRLENAVLKTEIFISNVFGDFQEGEFLTSRLSGQEIAIVTSNGTTVYPGKYTSTNGFLSWDRVMQDNYYYQEYSYVIKSALDTAKYSEVLKKLAHPSGTLFFGEYNLRIYFDNILDGENFTRFFTKEISYEVPFQDFITLTLESNVQQGSFSGRYIIEYEFKSMDFTTVVSNIINDTFTGTMTRESDLVTVSGLTETIELGDVLEITEPINKRITENQVTEIIDSTTYRINRKWAYYETDVNIKLIKNFDAVVELTENYHNYHTEPNFLLGIRSFNNIVDVGHIPLSKCGHYTINEIKENKWGHDFDWTNEPIIKNTIFQFDDVINNDTLYDYLNYIPHNTVLEFKNPYKYGVTNNLVFKMINY